MKGTRIYPDHFSRINPVLTGQSIGIKSREVRIAVDLLELWLELIYQFPAAPSSLATGLPLAICEISEGLRVLRGSNLGEIVEGGGDEEAFKG